MRRPPSRTSITIDEALSILLGRSAGPIEFGPIDDTDEAEANTPMFDLDEILEEEREVLDGEYRRAKFEKQPEHVIAEKFTALRMHEAVIVRAYDYRCVIADELNKGEDSVLKVDRGFSGAACKYLTMHSFGEWMKRVDGDRLADVQVSSQPKVRVKLRDQEAAILAVIKQQGFDPMALPRNVSGISGVKAAVRKALDKSPLFVGPTVFNKAWGRLLEDPARFGYSAEPSSPQELDGGDL